MTNTPAAYTPTISDGPGARRSLAAERGDSVCRPHRPVAGSARRAAATSIRRVRGDVAACDGAGANHHGPFRQRERQHRQQEERDDRQRPDEVPHRR